jgi:hypothetical protein
MTKRFFGQPVTEVTIKGSWEPYRTRIIAVDTAVVNVASASACSTAYHATGIKVTKEGGPAICTSARIDIRARTNTDTDVKGIIVAFNSQGGPGKKYPEVTLTKTGTRDGLTGQYLAFLSQPFDIGADDQVEFFLTDIGTATLIDIDTRQD